MVLGDVQAWAAEFLSVDERLLDRIATVWPKCLAVLPPHPSEDALTINLVAQLAQDPVVRRIAHWVEYQFEPFGDSGGFRFSKGKIDMAVFLDRDRERYLAYECKRLNVTASGGRASLAGSYVSEGMMRFISEKYAERLPVGCMLGYVVDGDVPFATAQINNAIASSAVVLRLANGPSALAAIKTISRFATAHVRASGPIEIRHALLSLKAI